MMSLILCILFFDKSLRVVVFLLLLILTGNFFFIKFLVFINSFSYLVNSEFIFIFWKFLVDSHGFRDFVRVNFSKLLEHLVFSCVYMDNILDVQTVNHVFGQDKGSANNYFIDELAA
jgi:hypothetical protein